MDSTDSDPRRVARRRLPFRFRLAWFIAALAPLLGCQESPYELATVRGTVTIDGRPLTAGKVMFAPVAKGGGGDAGKPAFGPLEHDGCFVLSTYGDGDGAVVGEHWVTIYGPGKRSRQVTPVSTAPKSPQFTKFTVPRKQTVLAGQHNEIHVAITSQDVARFTRVDD